MMGPLMMPVAVLVSVPPFSTATAPVIAPVLFARVADADRAFDSRVIGNFQILHGAVVIKRGAARAF